MNKLLVVLVALLVQACAFTDAALDVNHNSDANFRGPLSEVEATSFTRPALEDQRDDKVRIGWKKNGYGANTADITTTKPVEDILSEAIISGLKQNGHEADVNGRVQVTGTVDRFWFDTDTNFWTVEFIGDIQCTLVFIDATTGEAFYQSSYSGTYSEKRGGGLTATWTEIMNKSVNKVVEDVVFDQDLVDALMELERQSL